MTQKTYTDPTLPTAERVEDLLERMTVEEKVAQLGSTIPLRLMGPDGLDRGKLDEHIGRGIGQMSMIGMLEQDDPSPIVDTLNEIQHYLVNETRLGIPLIAHNEALAGLLLACAADFPTAIALAATWDPAIVEELCEVVRVQMRALGIHQALSPVLDVARDARWGRIHETYGEDPYLVSAIGAAFVRGLQGDDLRTGVLATAKHFVAYGASEGGRNLGAVNLSPGELYEVYARPFEAAIREAGLASVMNSYADLNGEPPTTSRRILTDLLRGRLGFEGFVVSDYWAIDTVATRQHAAVDLQDAGVQAVNAGLDVELPESSCFGERLVRAVAEGLVDIRTIDTSVRRVLRAKFELGLFEQPFTDKSAWPAVDGLPSHRQLAHRVATRSMVLLRNEGGLLPLSTDVGSVAVIGPTADSVRNLFAGYTAAAGVEMSAALEASGALETIAESFSYMAEMLSSFSEVTDSAPPEALAQVRAMYPHTQTVLDAVRATVSPSTQVTYAKGCDINGAATDGFDEAVRCARAADVAIVVVGDKTGWAFDATSGEGRDRASLDLPGAQEALLEAVCGTGTPVVAVLLNSRPTPVGFGAGRPAAVLEAWLPNSVGGAPIASVLFGHESPSGKLPITVPRNAGQCPIFAGHRSGSGYKTDGFGDGHTYTDLARGPAYPFGHGLTYTTFGYDRLTVERERVAVGGRVKIGVTVSNTGERPGVEVVQLYLRQRVRVVTRPVLQLVGFARVALEPGQRATATFDVAVEQLAHVNPDGALVVEPGLVEVMAGGSSMDLPLTGTFSIVGERIEIDRRETFSTACVVVTDS